MRFKSKKKFQSKIGRKQKEKEIPDQRSKERKRKRKFPIKDRKKDFVRRDTGSRKCRCPFKLHGKPMVGGKSWMVKLMCGIHNHELAKSLVDGEVDGEVDV